jgi:hypothetical protein
MVKKVTRTKDGQKLYGKHADSIPFHAYITVEKKEPLEQLRKRMNWTNNDLANMGMQLLIEKYKAAGIIS